MLYNFGITAEPGSNLIMCLAQAKTCSSQRSCELGMNSVLCLQVWKLRLTDLKQLLQGHSVSQKQDWEVHLGQTHLTAHLANSPYKFIMQARTVLRMKGTVNNYGRIIDTNRKSGHTRSLP